jgi:outer membrane receptor protein involved in Fe transport
MDKRISLLLLMVTLLVFGNLAAVYAQETASSEFTLEEITVTAEKRSVNLQTVASSIVALEASDLAEMGKITAAEMLESVPNLTFGELGRGGGDGSNISIRGVRKTQQPGGGSPVPPSTANYVDDVYGGFGGTFDVNRIEVLRGPQGTLYGRSATGGVVSFHTNDPKLQKYSADVSASYGTKALINTEAALNAPIGDQLALRAAVHYLHQAEGYYNGKGGQNETKEGRIKALYQPTDKLSFLLSFSASRSESWSAGYSQALTAPDTIDYKADFFPPNKGTNPTKKTQGSLHVNYDLEGSNLTYIAAMLSTDNRGKSAVALNRSSYQYNFFSGKPSKTQTHEIRWASNSESITSWLIGANYYKNTYDSIAHTWQDHDLSTNDPLSFNAPMFSQYNKGSITNYGIFTEETFNLSDDMRVTAGLRYDKTKILNYAAYDFNTNLQGFLVSFRPAITEYFPGPGPGVYRPDKPTFDNVTYKLRFEYDLTPENMVYALTSTGFLPGDSQINVKTFFAGFPPTFDHIGFLVLPYKQQLLTSYEVGTKNRFLDKKLQLNGSIFYYKYGGYQEAINTTPDAPPPPNFVVVRVPVRMIGFEMDGELLLSQNDKVTFSGGYLDAQLSSYPDVPGQPGVSAKTYMFLKRVPGLLKSSATLGYDHTFLFENGSTLAPRAQMRYSGGYYLGQVTSSEAVKTDEAGNSYLDYVYQGAIVLGDISATWTSPESNFSATAYVRNVTDKRYKTSATLPSGPPGTPTNVTVGDPRTYGVMFSAKF